MTDRLFGENTIIFNEEMVTWVFEYFLNSLFLGNYSGPVRIVDIRATEEKGISITFRPLSKEERIKIKEEVEELVREGKYPRGSKTEDEQIRDELEATYGDQII